MGKLKRIIDRLHRVFNRDPQKIPVVAIDAPGFDITIQDLVLTLTDNGGTDTIFDLSSGTLSALAGSLNATAGVTATVETGCESLLARGVLEDGRHQAGTLYYPTSLLMHEMMVYAWELDFQKAQASDATSQLYMDTASGQWLDYWCQHHFGIPRKAGETDDQYATRVAYEVVRPNQNNIALQVIVNDGLGVDAKILDAWPLRADLPVASQPKAPGRFLLDMGFDSSMSTQDVEAVINDVKSLVRKHIAAGTDFMDTALRKKFPITETQPVSETVALAGKLTLQEQLSPGPIQYGAGWVYGDSIAYGNNPGITEQVVIKTIQVSDGSIVGIQVVGG